MVEWLLLACTRTKLQAVEVEPATLIPYAAPLVVLLLLLTIQSVKEINGELAMLMPVAAPLTAVLLETLTFRI